MAARFDVFRLADDARVVVMESDRLAPMRTRVVAPLSPEGAARLAIAALNPRLTIADERLAVMTQLLGTLAVGDQGPRI
jgi:hypothetical protein